MAASVTVFRWKVYQCGNGSNERWLWWRESRPSKGDDRAAVVGVAVEVKGVWEGSESLVEKRSLLGGDWRRRCMDQGKNLWIKTGRNKGWGGEWRANGVNWNW
ncbi:hypothetical protein GOBAR_DD30801 [Gossypium barbadense]|nr:hypothetical protein GOBAR_DD30801 [Gossypium barbadense]